jgi:hypothetical protein
VAVFIAAADGVLSSAGAVWKTVDATSLLYDVTANTALTTSYVESQTFIPGAITITGIAVHVQSRAASPTGTMSVRLAQAGATVAGTEVTINVSDIDRPGGTSLHSPGLYFFKFAAPVLLVAATAYSVSAKTSSASQVNLYRNATAGNWSRLIRTDTFGNPGAGDDMHILGEWTAAGTKTNRTVTMDETAVTDYGSGSTNLNTQGFTIGKGGTLTYGNTAATNYVMRLSTGLRVWGGGTLNIGQVGLEIPRDGTAVLEFDCAADGDFGALIDGTCNIKGLSRTSGKNIVKTVLNTDEAAAQTVLGVADDTGWLNGDIVDIASTTRTFSQAEAATLNGAAGASSITVSAGITNAHSGTSPTQAEVVLVTRNVQVRSVSTSAMSFFTLGDTGVGSISWCWFRYMGPSTATDYKYGVQCRTQSPGSASFDYCSFTDFENAGLVFVAASSSVLDNITVNEVVCLSRSNQPHDCGFALTQTTGTNINITNVYVTSIDGSSGAREGIRIQGCPGAVISGLYASGCETDGIHISTPTTTADLLPNGVISNINSHSNQNANLAWDGDFASKLTNVTLWRCNSGTSTGGLDVSGPGKKTVVGGTFFGNSGQNVFQTAPSIVTLIGVTVAGDSTFSVASGFSFNGSQTYFITRLENCSFGDVSGIFTAHTSQDINFGGGRKQVDLTLVDTLLDSATELGSTSVLQGSSVVRYQRTDTATGVHKRVYYGDQGSTISRDTGTVRNSADSEKIAPSAAYATAPAESSVLRVRVESGDTVSVAVWGQKDASFSGTASLYLKANAAVGVDTDQLLATFSGAITTWVQMSGTTPAATENGVFEFVVRVTGTGGAFYLDDWSAS